MGTFGFSGKRSGRTAAAAEVFFGVFAVIPGGLRNGKSNDSVSGSRLGVTEEPALPPRHSPGKNDAMRMTEPLANCFR